MTLSADVKSQPTEFVGVIKLANFYIATHIQGNNKAFVSKHPETDIKVAQATAKLFAETNGIPYDNTFRGPNQPIITVLKHGQDWFPAMLHANKVTLFTSFGPLKLGGNQQEATNIANVIALSRGTDCIPSIGIFLDGIS